MFGYNTGAAGDSLTLEFVILFVVENLRLLLVCPDLKKLHEVHVVPTYKLALSLGFRDGMAWPDYAKYRSSSYQTLRAAAVSYLGTKFELAKMGEGEDKAMVLLDQAEKYMKACDYLWVHSCMNQKGYASRILGNMKLTPNNLEGAVEQLKLCRMVIEGVEPNVIQIIQSMRGLLPREVAETVAIQAHTWNHTADVPELDKFLQVVRCALEAKGPASEFTQRQVLGIQQATKNLQASVQQGEQEASTIIQEIRGLVTAVGKMGQQASQGRESRSSARPSSRAGMPNWVFAKGLCTQCGEKFQQGRACCNKLVGRNQANRLYPGVVFATAEVSHSTHRRKETPIDWLADLGSHVTGINAELPMAANIQWSRPSVRLISANGEALDVQGQAQVTLEFEAVPGKVGVRRTTTLFKIRGLSVDAVLLAPMCC